MTMRDEFEAWAVSEHLAVHRNGGEQYVNTPTAHAWAGYQAAAKKEREAIIRGASASAIPSDPLWRQNLASRHMVPDEDVLVVIVTPMMCNRWISTSAEEVEHFKLPGQGHRFERYVRATDASIAAIRGKEG